MSIVIGEGITRIGAYAFQSLSSATSVTFPSTVTSIGTGAFYECNGLTSVEVPESVTDLGSRAFDCCNALQSTKLPSHLTQIPNGLFRYCHALNDVQIPEGVTSISSNAFEGTALTSVELPAGLTTIGLGAFKDTGLTELVLPASVTSIGGDAFINCTGLTNVYFYGNCPTAETPAFYESGITFYYLPDRTGWTKDNVSTMVSSTCTFTLKEWTSIFGNCGTNVKWILEQNGEMVIRGSGDMADYTEGTAPWESMKNDIVKVTISDGVTGIGDNAFRKCDNLAEVKIGNSVTKIGSYAFGFCGALTEVTIPKSVATVGKEAFRDCNLTTVLFLGNRPEAGENAFAVPPENTVKMQYHEGRTGWTDANIISLGDVPIDMGYDRTNYEFSMQRHNWQNATHSKDATCTTLAERTYTCSVCQAAKTEKYGSLKAHTAGPWITTKSATCTGSGTRIQNCTVCKVQVNQQTTGALGHSFGGWTVTKEATVFAPRQEKRTCSRCKKVETRSTGSALKPTIKLNVTSIPLKVKQSTSVVKVSGLQNGDYVKSWKSNKTSVATVNKNGKITGKKRGTAKITVTLASGKKATVTVKVQLTTVLGKSITKTGSTKIKLERKAKYNLVKERNLAVYPLTAKQKMTFYSSNTKVAKVNSKGVITAVGGGTAKITVRSGLAKKLTFTVTVPKIRTTAISGLIPNLIFQKRGMTDQLEPVITPKNSDDKVTYKSSNKKVVTVSSSGKLKAKKKGKAVITVQSGNIKYKINVIVQR